MPATPTVAPTPTPAPRTLSDRLLGVLGGAMILAAVVVLLRGGARDGEGAAAAPGVEIVAPTAGAVLAGPLEVVFRPDREIGQMPSGWGVEGMHLHLQVDDVSYMPAGPDIVRLGDGHYRWRLGPLQPGEHAVRLYWSDAAHRPIGGGGSPTVRVRAK